MSLGRTICFFAAFSTRREDRYGLSEQDFINLFTPVVWDIKRKEKIIKFWKLRLVFFVIILCIGSSYCVKQYYDTQKSEQKSKDLQADVTEVNLEAVREKLKNPELDQKVRDSRN